MFSALPFQRSLESGGISAARLHPCCQARIAHSIPLCLDALLCKPQSARLCVRIRRHMACRQASNTGNAGVGPAYSDRYPHPSRNLRPSFSLAAVVLRLLRASLGKPLVHGQQLRCTIPSVFLGVDCGQKKALVERACAESGSLTSWQNPIDFGA